MKKGKWLRFGMGLCLLVSILFLPGTAPTNAEIDACALDCLESNSRGFLEIRNNTPFHILVEIFSWGKWVDQQKTYGPFKITANPTYMRIGLLGDRYMVTVNIFEPLTQELAYYDSYTVYVPKDFTTETLIITTPVGYYPVPKKK